MTDAELAILSLVAEGPQHGYQIQQAIEARSVREWAAIGFSSVYYVLNKLEQDGLLDSTISPSERGPARKVYEITQAGSNVLQTAVADLLSSPQPPGAGFAVGLANLHILRPDQVRHALDTYESRLRALIADTNKRRTEQAASDDDQPLYLIALYDYNLRMRLTELEWLQEFRQAWEAQAPPTLPAHDPMRPPVIRAKPTDPASPTKPHLPARETGEDGEP